MLLHGSSELDEGMFVIFYEHSLASQIVLRALLIIFRSVALIVALVVLGRVRRGVAKN
jgi:hypothetical protein